MCRLSKTWHKKALADGSASGKMTWGFGDARCTVDVKLARAAIISALKDGKAKLRFEPQTVGCIIETDKGPVNVTAVIAPKAEFEGGKAKKVWINLKHIEGPSVIRGLALTAARLEDTVGVFHGPLLRAVNTMLHETCPQIVAGK